MKPSAHPGLLASSRAALALVFLCYFAVAGRSLDIAATFTDLPESPGDPDHWQVSYQLSDVVFVTGMGLTIYFAESDYDNLAGPVPPVSSDWDPVVVQPDDFLSLPGFFDLLALVDDPSAADPFILTFDRVGPNAGRAQDFEFYTTISGFQILGTGRTTIPGGGGGGIIPEGGTWMAGPMIASVLVGMWWTRRRTWSSPSMSGRS